MAADDEATVKSHISDEQFAASLERLREIHKSANPRFDDSRDSIYSDRDAAPATTYTEYPHIVITPGIVGGEPRIAGTRMRVRDVVLARDSRAATPEEIVARIYPQLSLAQVYAALAYYEDHRAEVDALQGREDDYLDKLRKSPPPYMDVSDEQ